MACLVLEMMTGGTLYAHIRTVRRQTPAVLAAIADATDGDSVPANLALAENNARVAAEIAVAIAELGST